MMSANSYNRFIQYLVSQFPENLQEEILSPAIVIGLDRILHKEGNQP